MSKANSRTGQLSIQEVNGKLNISGLHVWSAITGVKGYGSPEEGDTFTTSDLDEMVKSHGEIGGSIRPRMYPGHPLNPMLKMLARPQGEITSLRREGNTLVADLKGVNKDFWSKAQEDGARLSPDVKLGHIDPGTGKKYPLTVVGLGVLGSAAPANQLLPALDEYALRYYHDHIETPAQQRAYGDPENIRSFAGHTLKPVDIKPAPKQSLLEALKALSGLEEAQ